MIKFIKTNTKPQTPNPTKNPNTPKPKTTPTHAYLISVLHYIFFI